MEQHVPEFDVAIVGAGWSGLMACKYCLADGLRPVVLESRDSVGGVWHYTDDQRFAGVMKTTRTTSSRCLTEISDFPMPADYPDFPSHRQINDYLDAYCERFSLRQHIVPNQHVERIVKQDGHWQITAAGGRAWSAPRLIIAAGVHRTPNDLSDDPRFRGYSGNLVHSAAVKEISADFADKTVIVWGGGESASDVTYELAKTAAATYWCIPNGQWFVPRAVDRWPPFPSARRKIVDQTTSRIRLLLSPTHQYSPFIYQYLEYAFGFNGHGQEAWRTPAPYNRSFFNKAAEVLDLVRDGRVTPKRDIDGCDGRLVRFSDGTTAEVDCIVMCSGYRTVFPFLDETTPTGTDPRRWFKHIFFDPDPSLAFVGFARPIFGSIPGLAELQSRYVAKVFSGECELPEPVERAATIERDTRYWQHHFRFTSQRLAGLVDHYVYSNQLARLIGCYPKFAVLLLSSPRRWWQSVLAPWNGCQFWLNNPEHHERIFATFRQYDENRISQNYVFLALAPILPLIGLGTHLRVRLREWLATRRSAVPATIRQSLLADRAPLADWWPGNRVFAPALAAAAPGGGRGIYRRAIPDILYGDRPSTTGGGGAAAGAVALAPDPASREIAAASVQTVAHIAEMLSGQRSRLEADRYIDPQITIHMDRAVHRGLVLWQKWLYLIRNCGRVRQLRLVTERLSADPADPAIVNLTGRWVGIGRADGVLREASHLSYFRYRLAEGRVVELWTMKVNYDFIIGNWLRSSLCYRLYLGWAIGLFRRLARQRIDYRVDRFA